MDVVNKKCGKIALKSISRGPVCALNLAEDNSTVLSESTVVLST